MVKKSNSDWRLCCDYRGINKNFRMAKQPLTRSDDILASFKRKKYFSVLDTCSGFYERFLWGIDLRLALLRLTVKGSIDDCRLVLRLVRQFFSG